MWKLLRRAFLIFPPVRQVRNQLHYLGNENARLAAEASSLRAERDKLADQPVSMASPETIESPETGRLRDELTALSRRHKDLQADYDKSVKALADAVARVEILLPPEYTQSTEGNHPQHTA